MAGFENDVMLAKNVNFDLAAAKPHLGIINAAGKLPIGTGNTSPTPEILAGKLVSPLGTLTIGYSSPNITLDAVSGEDKHVARFIVSAGGGSDGANYTTIASAITAASAAGGNQTIFIQPGTYVENNTIPAGINLTAFDCDALSPNVIILGKCTFIGSGTSSWSGIRFQTNGDYAIEITGANGNILYITSCYVLAANHTGILSSNPNSIVYVINSFTQSGGGGSDAIFSITTTHGFEFDNCRIGQQDATHSVINNGQVSFYNCTVGTPLTVDGGFAFYRNCIIKPVDNVGFLTLTSEGPVRISNCNIESGTATSMTIAGGTGVYLTSSTLDSSNATVASGAGTLEYGGVVFLNSSTITTTFQTPHPWPIQQGGTAASSFNINGTVISSTTTTGALTALTMTNGQVIIGSTGAAPVAATLTQGAGITITNAANSITIASTGGGFTWVDATGATQTLAAQTGYVTDRGGGVTYTLPASGTLGDVIRIVGKLGLGVITPNANQQILIGSVSGTVGVTGTATSNNVGDCIELVCITAGASSVYRAASVVGTWTLA